MTDTQAMAALERARHYVVSSMHDRDKSWGDLVLAGERDDCPEMRMVLKAMRAEAAHSPEPDTIGSHIGNGGRFDPAADEPVAQFRKVGCSDWYDGHPDLEDGRGPYDIRTLYAAPVPPPAGDAELRKALKLAIEHVEHMAAWVSQTNMSVMNGRYSFEALGEDMAGIKAALATPPSVPAQQGWLPIETAPKDGTAILGLLTGSDLPHTIRYRDGDWHIAWDDFKLWSSGDRPTGWQPLPTSPPAQDQNHGA